MKTLAGPDTDIDESISAFRVRGAMSGGTFQSLVALLEEVPAEKAMYAFADHGLNTGVSCSLHDI